MNLTTAIFLVNKSVRPVKVSYDPDNAKNNNPNWLFKTLDPDVKKGDMVVVPTTTRHGMTVCKVEEVDFRVNFDTTTEYHWIIGKVDVPAYESIKAQEETVTDRIAIAEENRKRQELAAAMGLGDINLTDLDIVQGATPLPLSSPRGAPAYADVPEAPPEAPKPYPMEEPL